jgi:hypothetical protein
VTYESDSREGGRGREGGGDSTTMADSLLSLSIHWSKRGSQMRETRKKE